MYLIFFIIALIGMIIGVVGCCMDEYSWKWRCRAKLLMNIGLFLMVAGIIGGIVNYVE